MEYDASWCVTHPTSAPRAYTQPPALQRQPGPGNSSDHVGRRQVVPSPLASTVLARPAAPEMSGAFVNEDCLRIRIMCKFVCNSHHRYRTVKYGLHRMGLTAVILRGEKFHSLSSLRGEKFHVACSLSSDCRFFPSSLHCRVTKKHDSYGTRPS